MVLHHPEDPAMPNFEKAPTDPPNGWNAQASIQVVPLNQSTKLRLAWGLGLELKLLDDDNKPMDLSSDTSVVEVTHGDLDKIPCPITIAGRGLGHRRLAAYDKDPPRLMTEPLKLYVVHDEYARVFDGDAPVVAPELGRLKGGSLLEAVVRVAEDQMSSGTYRLPGGQSDAHPSHCPGGSACGSAWWRCVEIYHGAREKPQGGQSEADANNWCGWFVQWCYAEAARVTGKANPYPRGDYLASGLKAATWAMASADLLILNWANPTGAPLHNPKFWGLEGVFPKPVNLAVPSPEVLKEGDVCLVRDKANPNRLDVGWKHVAIVHDIDWNAMKFSTLDGNAGGVAGDNTTGGLIGINRNKGIADTVPVEGVGTSSSAYKYVFLHLKGA
jgi:hypothetical protein